MDICAEPLKPLPLDLCRGQVHGEPQPVADIPGLVSTDQAIEHSRYESITRSYRAKRRRVSCCGVSMPLSVLLAVVCAKD